MIDGLKTLASWVVVVGLAAFGIVSCAESDWFKESQANETARRKAKETPHVIRRADGCDVYAFERDGRDHYFTRCQSSTSTETNWTENCGKNCVKHKADTIVTPNKQ